MRRSASSSASRSPSSRPSSSSSPAWQPRWRSRAPWLFDQGHCMREAAMAKLFASEVAQRVTWEAVQIFGGYGYITEFPVERFWRDARLMTITEGTTEIQLTIIAREIGL